MMCSEGDPKRGVSMADAKFNSRFNHWNATWRAVIFFLAASSIWCLLAEMYGLCSMRLFTIWILIPATFVLYALAFWDRANGDGTLWRGVMIGVAAGLAHFIPLRGLGPMHRRHQPGFTAPTQPSRPPGFDPGKMCAHRGIIGAFAQPS